jgi:hypothetical protein
VSVKWYRREEWATLGWPIRWVANHWAMAELLRLCGNSWPVSLWRAFVVGPARGRARLGP